MDPIRKTYLIKVQVQGGKGWASSRSQEEELISVQQKDETLLQNKFKLTPYVTKAVQRKQLPQLQYIFFYIDFLPV